MAGIVSYGAYIPLWRLARDTIAASWGSASIGGERSVANNDEDTVTMASEAAIDCLAGRSDGRTVPQMGLEFDFQNVRAYLLMTDCAPNEVRVDMAVEKTFRRLYEGAGMYNCFWKSRPIR
jgi:hypothetical protein